MEVEVFGTIVRDRPFTPYFLKVNEKTVIVTRVYTEAPTENEEPGWSDWSDERPFYKFKYTLPRGPRVVFIVPKTVDVSLEEFAKAMRSTKYFHAVKKWAMTPVNYMEYLGKIDTLFSEIPGEILLKIARWLYPEEISILMSFMQAKSHLNLFEAVKEAINDLKRFNENVKIEKEWDEKKKKYRLYAVRELSLRYDVAKVLPFTIKLALRVPLWEVVNYIRPLRDIVRLVVEIVKDPKHVNIRRIPEWKTEDAVRILENMLTHAERRLRSDHMEKIELFFKYHKHFHTPLD